jgi:hypothetical protein
MWNIMLQLAFRQNIAQQPPRCVQNTRILHLQGVKQRHGAIKAVLPAASFC